MEESKIEAYIFTGVLLQDINRSPDGGFIIHLQVPQYLKQEIAGVMTSETTVFTAVLTPHVTKEEE